VGVSKIHNRIAILPFREYNGGEDKGHLWGEKETMKPGKVNIHLLRGFLKKYATPDPRVAVGPEIGEDAAVIDPGKGSNCYWVVTADPITFTTDEMGYYGVVVNMNDIATRGAIPKWFLATLLFPEKGTDRRIVERAFRQIHKACKRFNISLIGGHTEITPGIERLILSGNMIGEVKKEKLVTTGGGRTGDLLLLIKGVCIEGTSIIAREKRTDLIRRGISPAILQRAKNYIYDPGIEVLHASRIACGSASVHSMHDPTEGGLINGILEMAIASHKEIEVDLENVPIYRESRILCGVYGLNPLGVIASGALLLTISPSDLSPLERAFKKASIPTQVIGKVKKGPTPRVLTGEGKRKKELHLVSRDEILKIFE
jgi:hydrogenase expression/formation protein HypE